MDFEVINNGFVLVWGKLTFFGVGMIPLEAEVGDVVIHGKVTGVMGVVPFEIDISVKITFPFFSDVIVLFEGILKVMGMAVANIFKNKVVNNDTEEDTAPRTRSDGALLVSILG